MYEKNPRQVHTNGRHSTKLMERFLKVEIDVICYGISVSVYYNERAKN